MEQQLINELIRMISKMGGNAVMKDLINTVDRDGDAKTWTAEEIQSAVDYVHWQNSYFGKADVTAIIELLIDKYNIRKDDLPTERSEGVIRRSTLRSGR